MLLKFLKMKKDSLHRSESFKIFKIFSSKQKRGREILRIKDFFEKLFVEQINKLIVFM